MDERKIHWPFEAQFKSVVGVDAHGKNNFACHFEPVDPTAYVSETEKFSATPEGNRDLVSWVILKGAEAVFLESGGVNFELLLKALANVSLLVFVVPRQAKNLPGRPPHMSDSLWLAPLGCYGLLPPSFVSRPRGRRARPLPAAPQSEDGARSRQERK
ncbi:MAG: hypothetical protein LBO66_14080 [Deltaproteobacteria bacterium]|jgi:hypothetical protein|nr:hypothetical protein [Deltaproteobacteria bacterium]